MTTVDLRVEAQAEVERLVRVRAFLREGDASTLQQLESDATWIAIARSTRLRQTMRGADLQLWRVALENGEQRLVESAIVAVRIERGVSVDSADLSLLVERSTDSWRGESIRIGGQFGATRLARERAIVAARPDRVDAVQPGLFDRRAHRLHADRAAEQMASREEDQARLAALERTLSATVGRPRLLLAMVSAR